MKMFYDAKTRHTRRDKSPLDWAAFLALLRSGVALERVGNTGVLVLDSSARASSYALTLVLPCDSRTDEVLDLVRMLSECGVFEVDILFLTGVELVSFCGTAHALPCSSPTHIVSLRTLSSSNLMIRFSHIIWLSRSISWSTSTHIRLNDLGYQKLSTAHNQINIININSYSYCKMIIYHVQVYSIKNSVLMDSLRLGPT